MKYGQFIKNILQDFQNARPQIIEEYHTRSTEDKSILPLKKYIAKRENEIIDELTKKCEKYENIFDN